MGLIRDDRNAHFQFLEQEGLLYRNTDTWMPCPGSYGFVSDLPQSDSRGSRRETEGLLVLGRSLRRALLSLPRCSMSSSCPILLRLRNRSGSPIGVVAKRCMTGLHFIEKAIPNLRAVSVSGWSDFFKMGELLGKKYVYSRKPTPAYISGAYPDWDLCEEGCSVIPSPQRKTAIWNCVFEISTRLMGIGLALRQWVEMTRAMMNG